MIVEIIGVILIVFGAGIALIGSIGLARFPDVFTRLHGPTKATTLGVGGVLLGTILYLVVQGETGVIRELLITVFLFLTAPVSAHLIAKAALHRRCQSVCEIPTDNPETHSRGSDPLES
jgi:multicomponent K+:H+ antiporter subunit G